MSKLDNATRILIDHFAPDVVIYLASSVKGQVSGWSMVVSDKRDGSRGTSWGNYSNVDFPGSTAPAILAVGTALGYVTAHELRAVILLEDRWLRDWLSGLGTIQKPDWQRVDAIQKMLDHLNGRVVFFPINRHRNQVAVDAAEFAANFPDVGFPYPKWAPGFPVPNFLSREDFSQ